MKNDSLLFAASRNYHINWRWEKNSNGQYPDYNKPSKLPEIYTRYFGSSRSNWVASNVVLRKKDPRWDYTSYGSTRSEILRFSDYYDAFFDWGAVLRIENLYLSYYLGNSFPDNVPEFEGEEDRNSKIAKIVEWHTKNFMELEIYLVDLDIHDVGSGTGSTAAETASADGYTLLSKVKLFNTGMITQQNILSDLLCNKHKNIGMFQGLWFLLRNSGYGSLSSPDDFVSVFVDVSLFITGQKRKIPQSYVRHINAIIPSSYSIPISPLPRNEYPPILASEQRFTGFRSKIILTNTGSVPITLNFFGSSQQGAFDKNRGLILTPGAVWNDNQINSDRIAAIAHTGEGRLSGMESMIGPPP